MSGTWAITRRASLAGLAAISVPQASAALGARDGASVGWAQPANRAATIAARIGESAVPLRPGLRVSWRRGGAARMSGHSVVQLPVALAAACLDDSELGALISHVIAANDTEALSLAARAGYDPSAALRLWNRLRDLPFAAEQMAASPFGADRQDRMRRMLAAMGYLA